MTQQEYLQQFETFQQQSVADARFAVVEPSHPILNDDKEHHDEKDISQDYLWHTAWAARKIASSERLRHVDIASYVYFAALCSAFVPVFQFWDIRPVSFPLDGLQMWRGDVTALPIPSNSEASISMLHSLEHVGLGRYGDKLDAQGDLKAAAELTRILAPGGQLLMVLPMNEKPCVRFNGERFYSFNQVIGMFHPLRAQDVCFITEGQIKQSGFVLPAGDYTGCFAFTKERAISA